MIKCEVALGCIVEAGFDKPTDPDLLEEALDRVMSEFLRLEVADPSIDATLTAGTVTFTVTVEAANPVEAVNQASMIVRSAIHAAGGGTPDWPGPVVGDWAARLVRVGSSDVGVEQLVDA